MEYNLPGNYRIISSEKPDGSMTNLEIENNLPKFLDKNGVTLPIAYCQQVHGAQVKIINKKGFYPECDALVTGEDLAIVIKSADCIPLFFFDSKRGVVGGLHVGRKSLAAKIISVSLKQVFEKMSLSPTELIFFLGPHIRVENYEIKEDVASSLPPQLQRFIIEKDQKTFFNLTEAVLFELELIGAKRENVVDCKIDTYKNDSLFSYRHGDSGLFVTLISKK